MQLARDEDVQAAARAADAAGLYGRRIFVAKSPHPLPLSQRERGEGAIGLANNVADAAIVLDDPQDAPPKAELFRVLRPGGKALVGDNFWEKLVPLGMDDWSHHYHGPDNNPQSRDKLARAPLLMQFIAEPRFAPGPQSVVAAAGRVFMALGHVAWHQHEEPVVNTLIAVNGLNGTLLWKYPLRPGIMVDRSTMIATPTTLYLANDSSCKLLDAASGKLQDENRHPGEPGGRHLLEMDGPGPRPALRPHRPRRTGQPQDELEADRTRLALAGDIQRLQQREGISLGLRPHAPGHRPQDEEGPLAA